MKHRVGLIVLLVCSILLLTGCNNLWSVDGNSSFSSEVVPGEVVGYVPQKWALNASNFSSINEKDIVTFGTYEQDNNTENGTEDIEWIVLRIERGKALLTSKYVLDARQFDESHEEVYWENSDIRRWLNGAFYQTAFSKKDKELIYKYEKDDVNDNVFLLNYSEANLLLKSANAVQTSMTNYADSKTPLLETIDDWWLRDTTWYRKSGNLYYKVVGDPYDEKNELVRFAQQTSNNDFETNYSRPTTLNGVRPSVWVCLE